MDEREIESISRILPLRKLAVARPARGGRELKYQLNQYYKAKNQKSLKSHRTLQKALT